MNLFGVGPTEILVVLIVVLVLFGPDKLPELAKKIGGASRELRDGLDTINEQMNTALEASMELEKAQMLKPAAVASATVETQTIAPPAETATAPEAPQDTLAEKTPPPETAQGTPAEPANSADANSSPS